MFPNKNWSLDGLKALMKKIDNTGTVVRHCVAVDLTLSAQYLCCQFFLILEALSVHQFLLGNSLSNCFTPYFLLS